MRNFSAIFTFYFGPTESKDIKAILIQNPNLPQSLTEVNAHATNIT